MKKIVFAALAATVFATPAFAQSSDTVAVSGVVAPVCTIDAASSTATVNLSSAAAQNGSSVTINCNSAGGSTVTVSSDNGGKLVGPNGSSFAYQVGAMGQFVTPTIGGVALPQIPAAMQFGISPLTSQIKVGARTGNQYAGTYSDT
ncbi:MAG: hypothetical protein EON58_13570, partial [Alphaproteobacteria bacterium]